jgi:hypothetical protein
MTAVCSSNLADAIHFFEPMNQINLRQINLEQLNLFSRINLEILFSHLSDLLI